MNDLLARELMTRTAITDLLRKLVCNEEVAPNEETRRMICSLSSRIHKLPYYPETLPKQEERIQEVKQEEPQQEEPEWVIGKTLPFLHDINKKGKWTADEFCGTLKLPLKSYMWFKFKCMRNKTGRCFKTFYCDLQGKLYYSFKELKANLKYGDIAPDYEWSCTKKSIHWNVDDDILYIGGGNLGAPVKLGIKY